MVKSYEFLNDVYGKCHYSRKIIKPEILQQHENQSEWNGNWLRKGTLAELFKPTC